jgi:hypothetical protein
MIPRLRLCRRSRAVAALATALILIIALGVAGRVASPARAAQTAPTPTPISFTVIGKTPTATATATAAAPTATPRPTPSPTATTPPPTAPTTSAASITFDAQDWQGGLFRGDGQAYGRPWVAIYGAQSQYPRATLSFELPAAPSGPVAFHVAGLDDEIAGPTSIAIEINGATVQLASPFADFNADFTNANWTELDLLIPAELLQAGQNSIAFANLAQSASVGLPPYFLLGEGTIQRATDAAVGPATTVIEIQLNDKNDKPEANEKKGKDKGNDEKGNSGSGKRSD